MFVVIVSCVKLKMIDHSVGKSSVRNLLKRFARTIQYESRTLASTISFKLCVESYDVRFSREKVSFERLI